MKYIRGNNCSLEETAFVDITSKSVFYTVIKKSLGNFYRNIPRTSFGILDLGKVMR